MARDVSPEAAAQIRQNLLAQMRDAVRELKRASATIESLQAMLDELELMTVLDAALAPSDHEPTIDG